MYLFYFIFFLPIYVSISSLHSFTLLPPRSAQLARLPELDTRVAELNRALHTKVAQSLQTAMQLEEAKAELVAYERAMADAVSSAAPDSQARCVYVKKKRKKSVELASSKQSVVSASPPPSL